MEDYTITMRLWTCMGKENIFLVDYFHIKDDHLVITGDREQHIYDCINRNGPCNISFSYENKQVCFDCCSLDHKGAILFETCLTK